MVIAPVGIGYTNPVMTALGRNLDRLERILRVLRRVDTAISLARPPYGETLRALDHETGARVRGLQTPRGAGVARVLTQAGSWVTHVGVMADGAAIARRRSDPTAAVTTVVSMAGCSGVYTLIKAMLGRERPDPDGHLVTVRDASFPSGHAATAAAAARTLADLHDWPKLPLFVAAAAVAGSRVYLGVHHPSDAVAGLVIGWTWASVVTTVVGHSTHARGMRVPESGAAESPPEGEEVSSGGVSRDLQDASQDGDSSRDRLGYRGADGRPSDQLGALRRARRSGHPVTGDEQP